MELLNALSVTWYQLVYDLLIKEKRKNFISFIVSVTFSTNPKDSAS
jgi:hypothetical protein